MPRAELAYPVRSLFQLLNFLGVSQQEICDHLGMSKTMVSQWANRRRLMPERHIRPLVDLIHQTLRQRAQLLDGRPTIDLETGIQAKAYLDDWFTEISASILMHELADICRGLAPYANDPSKLQAVIFSPEGIRLRDMFEQGLHHLKRLEHVYGSSAQRGSSTPLPRGTLDDVERIYGLLTDPNREEPTPEGT
jgi:transcriptional regulator with XRE-family HTH domain